MKTLRIGIFYPTLHLMGGGEYATIIMINALKKHGYHVIVSSNKKIDQAKIMDFFGEAVTVDAQIVSPAFQLFKWNPYRSQFVYINAFQSYVLSLNCDILIDAFSRTILPWADIIYFHGLPRDLSLSSKREIYLLPYLAVLSSSRVENKIVLANSKFVGEQMEKRDVHCNILPPPVNVGYFSSSIENQTRSRKNIVVTISRFSKEKGLERIPSIAKLTDENIFFIIAGSVESNTTLYSIRSLINKLKISHRVKLLTNVSREKLRTLLWDSKVYLHTREYEPFGITIVEAMSAGCIPVVHDSGGPREFVPGNLRYKTIEEGAMKIERAINRWTTKRMEKMINSARNFDVEKFSERFLDVLDRAVEAKSRK